MEIQSFNLFTQFGLFGSQNMLPTPLMGYVDIFNFYRGLQGIVSNDFVQIDSSTPFVQPLYPVPPSPGNYDFFYQFTVRKPVLFQPIVTIKGLQKTYQAFLLESAIIRKHIHKIDVLVTAVNQGARPITPQTLGNLYYYTEKTNGKGVADVYSLSAEFNINDYAAPKTNYVQTIPIDQEFGVSDGLYIDIPATVKVGPGTDPEYVTTVTIYYDKI